MAINLKSSVVVALVPSSSELGRDYAVSLNIETATLECQCPGYTYRKHCRHLEDVLAAIEADPKWAAVLSIKS